MADSRTRYIALNELQAIHGALTTVNAGNEAELSSFIQSQKHARIYFVSYYAISVSQLILEFKIQ